MSEQLLTEEETTFLVEFKKVLPAVLSIVSSLGPLTSSERGVVIAKTLIAYYGEEKAIEFANMVSQLIPQVVEQDSILAKKAATLPDGED